MILDMADVKPTLLSWIIVGLLASSFILAAKAVLNRYPVRGLTELANAV